MCNFIEERINDWKLELEDLEKNNYNDMHKLLKLNMLKNRFLNYACDLCDVLYYLKTKLKAAEEKSEEIRKIVGEINGKIEKINNKKKSNKNESSKSEMFTPNLIK